LANKAYNQYKGEKEMERKAKTVETVKEENTEKVKPATETAETAQNAAENANTETTPPEEQKLDAVEVPENAEEITQEQALQAAADEVNRLREENTEIKQQLDDVIKKTNEEAAIAGKQIQELEEKLAAVEKVAEEKTKQLEAAAKTSGSNAFYVEFLTKLEEKFNEYSGIRRERLRKEFITDITEEIQRQKEQLTNA